MSRTHRILPAIATVALIYLGLGARAVALDNNATQQVWRLKYGVSSAQLGDNAWLDGDADGDGVKSRDEIAAGTNPFAASSTIRVSSLVKNGANVEVQFPTQSGKRYRVERTGSLTVGPWVLQPQPTPVQVIGDGAVKMLSVAYVANNYYRVRVDDLDTDGDGLADWVEGAVSLSPTLAQTVPGVSDYSYVTAQIALPNVVSIKATDPFALEDGPVSGSLTITRTQKLLPITVNYTPSGTAIAGTDYNTLPGSVSLASGVDTSVILVTPIADVPLSSVVEGSKSVTATLVATPLFDLGTPSSATVIINDSTVATGTGLLGRYYDTASATYIDAANFGQAGTYTYTRTVVGPPASGNIVVPYTGTPAVAVGNVVKISFTSGNLNNALYNNANYTVTAVTAGVSFTVGISSATALPGSGTGNCNFSIQSFPHPGVVTRVDPTVNFNWLLGTPNGVVISPNNSPENYSATWDGYLQPTTAGTYIFQLDADDKARVLLDTGGGLVEILEHGWDGAATPETIGTFKQSAPIVLAVPATPAQRYHIRVEHVETTGDATCRLQWNVNGGVFANIPQAQVFTHTQAMTYSYVRAGTTPSFTGTIVVTPTGGHSFVGGELVTLSFSSGNLFTPGAAATFNGVYTITAVTGTVSYTVGGLAGATLPASGSGNGFVVGNTTSTTIGLYNACYANTTFANSPGRLGVDAAVTVQNNGVWGVGSPDVALIQPDTFSVRWTGQVQPQFSEEYTFVVQADDSSTLWINGQPQVLRTSPSTNQGGSTYLYDSATGNTLVAYPALVVSPGSFIVGETVRLDPSTGNLAHAPTVSPTYSYDGGTGIAVIDYSSLTNVTPGGFVAGDTIELDPTTGNIQALGNTPYVILAAPAPTATTFAVTIGTGTFATGTGNININDSRNAVITALHAAGTGTYSYDGATGAVVVNYSTLAGVPASSFAIGGTVQLDPTSGNLNPLANAIYSITAATATTFTVNAGTGTFATGTGNINIVDPRTGIIPDALTTAFSVNIGAGKYAANSVGSVNLDIVNKPLKDWSVMTNDRFVHIPMIGGVRYDIQLDYYENNTSARCLLSWYSPSLPKQIIPSERLYPSNGALAPAVHISPTAATALVGGPFSHKVEGSNGAVVTISGAPAWLTYGAGVLSGTPTAGSAGDYQILITITNAAGASTSLLNLHVEDTGGTIVRELWTGVAGTTVASIPTGTTPNGAPLSLTSLEGPTNAGDNYGARIRGYITAPVTGNYYFWIAASDAAELWIANDDEPINIHKRAWVTTGNITPRTWSGEANQKSPWLALEAGQRYYIEILHKAGNVAGNNDNLAIGWLMPGETGTAPSQVVPGYVLSPYVAPSLATIPGTLYVSTMLSQSGAATNGVGTSTLRLSADENTASMRYSYSGLTGGITSQHIHTDPYLSKPSTIVFDIDTPVTPGDGLQADGSYKWTILPVGTLSKAEIIEIIKQGKAYINLHTAAFPNGEIRGNYTLANGSRTFTPPPAPPALADDHTTNNGASRFLTQATFGPNPADIAALKAMASYDAWITDQFAKLPSETTHTLAEVLRTEFANAQGGAFDETLVFNAWWKSSASGTDQLRQRVAYALSQIHVVSAQGPLDNRAEALAYFYDHLVDHAFGNFRDILEATTLTPTMGRYLDMLRNDKPDLTIGRSPNENYAREIKQLFSIGLFRMWPDGTLMLNSKDELIPTYTQREIVGFAHVFTGWDYGYDGADHTALNSTVTWVRQMREVPARHFTGEKRVLNNEVLPGLATVGGQPLDPYATHNTTHFSDAAYRALPGQELDASHNQLANHPNVGPFVCRQLIQRMVTSNPSRDYLYRVVQKFNDNGSGVRGDMQAVIKAILLDYEARSTTLLAIPAFGKQREPVLRVAAAGRAFRPTGFSGTYVQTAAGGRTITVTTATPHQLATGNNVFLDFTSGTPAPWIGSYAVTVTGANTFTVLAQGWATGTYSQAANSPVMTITMGSHWLGQGQQAYFDFTSGTANGLAGFDNTVQTAVTSDSTDVVAGAIFTITAPTSASARSGNVMIPRFNPGSYTTSRSGLAAPNDTRVIMDTNTDHHLNVGNQVQINFFQGNPLPTDMVVTVDTVVDLNTWTFLAPSAGTNLGTNQGNNAVYQFPLLSQPLVRNGNVSSRPSTFNMGSTDVEIDQSPLNSPTVFNFYLPDYKFPGALASQGITTPEFQETAETSVIRQANFLERGVYALGNTNGLASFKSGTNALVMDLSPWMANATGASGVGLILGAGPQTAQAWTSNANLPTLIDRLNTLLLGGALPASVKTEIQAFVSNTTNIPYNNGAPSDPEKTARIRAVLHFLLTSPDFTIQR